MGAMAQLMKANAEMHASAQEVIFRRCAMMAMGVMSGPETARMVLEKPATMATAVKRAAMTAARGGDAVAITAAALAPFRRETGKNARRLRR